MAIITIQMIFNGVNSSAQVGDIVYYSTPLVGSTGQVGGFDTAEVSETKLLGKITNMIGANTIWVEYDSAISSAPPVDSYISFVKDKRVNTTSLVGYYANINLMNNSTKKIELFSVGSEVSESSK